MYQHTEPYAFSITAIFLAVVELLNDKNQVVGACQLLNDKHQETLCIVKN